MVFGQNISQGKVLRTPKSRRAYYEDAIRKLIEYKMINIEDRVAYIGGSLGETGGTTYLDINTAKEVLEAKDKYNLPDYTL